MSTISQVSSSTGTQGSAAQTSTTSSSAASSAQTAGDDSNTSVKTEVEKAEVSISSRAQKLQKLAEEFFPGGPSTLKVSSEFIQRLQDYGFLSQTQVDSLPDNLKTASTGDSGSAKLDTLISDAQKLLDKLEGEDKTNSLFEAIDKAQQELKRFESTGSLTSSKDANSIIGQLSEQMDSDVASELRTDEAQLVKDMAVSLKLISSFATKTEALKGVDSYLSGSR